MPRQLLLRLGGTYPVSIPRYLIRLHREGKEGKRLRWGKRGVTLKRLLVHPPLPLAISSSCLLTPFTPVVCLKGRYCMYTALRQMECGALPGPFSIQAENPKKNTRCVSRRVGMAKVPLPLEKWEREKSQRADMPRAFWCRS